MRVPLQKKDKTKKKRWKETDRIWVSSREFFFLFFSFFFSNLLSQIHGNLTVGIRRDKHEKCSTQRGLRVGTRNTGFHQEFR